MNPANGIQRRFAMSKMFVQHYFEQIMGKGYPRSIDRVSALLTTYEKQTLFRLAKNLPTNSRLAEIGSFRGGSTCCLGAGVVGKDAIIHCIDTFMAENITGGEGEDTFQTFQENTRPYAESIQVHRGFSYDLVDKITDSLDLLFIDGDHSWEGVTNDLKLYLPLMKDSSIIIMHDSAHPPVQRAIQEMILPLETKRLATLPNLYAGRIRKVPADFMHAI